MFPPCTAAHHGKLTVQGIDFSPQEIQGKFELCNSTFNQFNLSIYSETETNVYPEKYQTYLLKLIKFTSKQSLDDIHSIPLHPEVIHKVLFYHI